MVLPSTQCTKMRNFFVFVLVPVWILCCFGCESERTEDFLHGPDFLTADQRNTLGFENSQQWTNSAGNSTVHTEGNYSLQVNANGWTVAESIPLSSLGTVSNTLQVDLKIPQSVYWGDFRIIIKVPSQGVWYQEIFGPQLTTLPVGSFNTVNFILPPNVVTALNGSYSDLRISVVLNAPAASSPYLVDNIRIGWTNTSGDSDTPTESAGETDSQTDSDSNLDTGVDTSSDTINTDTDTEDLLVGVYALTPDQITDSQLDAFRVEPSVIQPSIGQIAPPLPDEIVYNGKQNNYVFEGFLVPRTAAEQQIVDQKRAHIDAYFDSLDENSRIAFETRVHDSLLEKRRLETFARGEAFDERDDISVMITTDGAVWRVKKAEDFVEDTGSKPGWSESGIEEQGDDEAADEETVSAPALLMATFGTEPEDRASQLTVISAYMNYDMTAHNQRVHGCLAWDHDASQCTCSGTKISARMVLTAGHCLTNGEETWDSNIVAWIPGVDRAGSLKISSIPSMPNGTRSVVGKYVHSHYFDHEWANYDMGVAILSTWYENCRMGWLGYNHEDGLTDDTVNIRGVPGISQPCANTPLGDGTCGGSLYGAAGKVVTAGGHMFRYDIETYAGMSGGGVYKYYPSASPAYQRVVIGNHKGDTPNYGRAVKINRGKLIMINDIRKDYPDSTSCQNDDDRDGIAYLDDNCSAVFNPEQNDPDGNGIGLACDSKNYQTALTAHQKQDFIRNFSVWADQSLYINDRAEIFHPQDNKFDETVWGNYVELGHSSRIPSVMAGSGGVHLRPYANVRGNVISQGPIVKDSNANVEHTTKENQSLNFPTLSFFSVDFPTNSLGDLMVDSADAALYPATAHSYGKYGRVTVKSGRTLTLSQCADYYLDELVMEPGSFLDVRGSQCGGTRIFIKDNLIFRGQIYSSNGESFSGETVLFGVFGTSMIPIESYFQGTIVAPNAPILMQIPNLMVRGSFYARNIFIHQDITVYPAQFVGDWMP